MLSAVKYLLKKNNGIEIDTYTDGNVHEMYTFEHDATEQTPALTDYRYIGSNPYNYVTFNGETWRIIGIFYVENENGHYNSCIKIVRNEKLSEDMAFDASSRKWEESELREFLNGEYYNSFSNDKQLITKVKYYLGGTFPYGYDLSSAYFYASERGQIAYSGYQLNWIGKIALIYASDYTYTYAYGIDNNCYNKAASCSSGKTKGWIYNISVDSNRYILSPEKGHGYNFMLSSTGSINIVYHPYDVYSIVPALYLKPNVKIKQGDGTIDNPYEFEL